jgi:gas vesicle protein
MRTPWVLPVLLLSVLVTPASAKGCLKGAVVGGVAGHYAGHHGVIGAAAGCHWTPSGKETRARAAR